MEAPEIAFTGDTSAEFLTHPGNEDVFRARLLIMVGAWLGAARVHRSFSFWWHALHATRCPIGCARAHHSGPAYMS